MILERRKRDKMSPVNPVNPPTFCPQAIYASVIWQEGIQRLAELERWRQSLGETEVAELVGQSSRKEGVTQKKNLLV